MKAQTILLLVITLVSLYYGKVGGAATCLHPACNFPKGELRKYTLEVRYETLPGSNKRSITFNGTVPGPLLEVNENDELEITVINRLEDSGTIVHWHGLYQYYTNFYDGVPGITQCIIPSNGTFVNRFTASPAGTMFYHGHYNGQYTDGLFGPLIIHRNGGDFDQKVVTKDLVLMVNDYYNYTTRQLIPTYLSKQNPMGDEPIPDAIQLNGQFDNQLLFDVKENDFVRLRLINSAAFSFYNISVDFLPMQVVAVDGVDVHPSDFAYIYLNVAQRIDVHLNFSQLNIHQLPNQSKAIYLRVNVLTSMYPVDLESLYQPSPPYPPNTKCALNPSVTAVFSFDKHAKPKYKEQPPFLPSAKIPRDFNFLDMRPVDSFPAPAADHFLNLTILFSDRNKINYAFLNGISFNISQFTYPTQLYLQQQKLSNHNYLNHLNDQLKNPKISLANSQLSYYYIPADAVMEITLNNQDGGDHPFHLHGHNYWVVGCSDNPQAEATYSPNFMRRDVVTVPANGWAKIRYVVEAPAINFFHCHIEWHIGAGLGTMFVEAPSLFHNFTIPDNAIQLCADYYNSLDDSSSSASLHLMRLLLLLLLFLSF